MSDLTFTGVITAPVTPNTNNGAMFYNSATKTLFLVDDLGTITQLGGGVLTVQVSDISDPSVELNPLEGAFDGQFVACVEAVTVGDNSITIYSWDSSPSTTEDVPFTVDGQSGGRWVSFSGRFVNQVIESAASENKIRAFFSNFAALPSPSDFHGMAAHVHAPSDPLLGESAYYAHANFWQMVKDHHNDDEVTLTPASSVEIDFGKQSRTYQSLTLDQNTTLTEANAISGVERWLRIDSATPGQTLTFPGNWTVFGEYDTSGAANLIRVICVSPTVEEIQAGGAPAAAYLAFVVNQTASTTSTTTGLTDDVTGLMVVNGGDPSHLDIKDSQGQIENRTDPTSITRDLITWSGLTNLTVPTIGLGAGFTFVYIIDGGGGVGVPLFESAGTTGVKYRTRILLGILLHPDGLVIGDILTVPVLTYDYESSLVDLFQQRGDENNFGNEYSANGLNKLLNKSPGLVFGRQINIDAAALQPHLKATIALTSISPYSYSRKNGSGGFTLSTELDIDVDRYDDGTGVLALVPAGEYHAQPIRFDPRSDGTLPQYAQSTHATLNEAIDSINLNDFDFNPLFDPALPLTTWLIMKQGTANLSNPLEANFRKPLKNIVAGSGTVSLHAGSHESGGTDEINVAGLSGQLADGQTPIAHVSTHENGGSDELNVAGLSGQLADGQTPILHGSTHENGAADEFSLAGLSGLLADNQNPVAHGSAHDPGSSDPITTAIAGAIQIGDAADTGSAGSVSRSDHRHSFDAPAAPVNVTKASAATGTATEAARADHKHDLSTAAAVAVGAANAEGSATTAARSDHTHEVTNLTIASEDQGDILYRNASAWVRLAPGTDGQVLNTNGAAADPTWEDLPSGPDALIIDEPFTAGNFDTDEIGIYGWKKLATGTGNDVAIIAEAGHQGIMSLGGGTAAAGRVALFLGGITAVNPAIVGVNQNDISCEFLVRLTGSIGSGDLERVTLGWGDEWDAGASVEHNNGVWVEFDPSTASSFRLRTGNGGARSGQNGTTTVVIDTWYRVGVQMTYPGGVPTAQLVVNGTSEGSSLTTNITVNAIGFGMRVEAGPSVATESRLDIDRARMVQEPTLED